jgi:hypothetical protein
MQIAFLVVILIMAVGLSFTVVSLIGYLFTKRKVRLRNAAISFASVALSFPVLIVVEELFFSYNSENKKEVMVASREAPLGGILLRLYEDSTFEIGGFRQVEVAGTFGLRSDTLFIIPTDNPKRDKYTTQLSFIIKEGHLEEVEDSGLGLLQTHMNKLK